MASSSDERNQRNAKILQANVFYNDLCLICQFSFNLFDKRKHNYQFLQDTIEFTHIMLEMLDEYSKGKVLTIQTQRKRKVKKIKKKNKKTRQGDLNVDNDIEEFMDEELDFDEDQSDSDEEEANVERQFNFVSELSVLVDYNVIDKYI